MTLFERLFFGLERIDTGLTKVSGLITARREKRAADQSVVDEAMARQAERKPRDVAAATRTPLGDPSIAIQIYGRRADPWTGRALLIVRDQELPHTFVELEEDDGRLQARLQSETQQDVLPYVYIRGEFIGGYNAFDELNRLGTLEDAIRTPEERAARKSPIAIIVPKRGPERAPPGERH